jgi:predicted transposase YbfD/YdcC
LSAFACEARWVLGQVAVDGKSNEIRAIPDLLEMLELRGATVSIDAMGCQEIAAQIVEGGADYVLALKDNHPTLHEDVRLWLDTEATAGRLPVLETLEKDHGRLEVRRYRLSSALDWLDGRQDWRGLRAVGRVEAERHMNGKVSLVEPLFSVFFRRPKPLCHGRAGPLAHRELPALGAGCCVWRRRPSHPYESWAGKPGLDSPDGAELGATKRPPQGKP